MTQPKLDCIMKRLGKMILSEPPNDGPDYELAERYIPVLMDLGYVEYRSFPMRIGNIHIDCSKFFSTEKGREAYFEWVKKSASPCVQEKGD